MTLPLIRCLLGHALYLRTGQSYRLDFWSGVPGEEDPGVSLHATLVPLAAQSVQYRAVKVLDLHKLVHQREGGLLEVEATAKQEDDGWRMRMNSRPEESLTSIMLGGEGGGSV
jgi:hypothetical protein